MKKNYLLENVFLALQEKEKLIMMVKYQTVTLSFKDYLKCEKIWDEFDMKNMGDCHDHILKKMHCY